MLVATFFTVTVAPGMTAPDGSVMLPLMEAVESCAWAIPWVRTKIAAQDRLRSKRVEYRADFRERRYIMVSSLHRSSSQSFKMGPKESPHSRRAVEERLGSRVAAEPYRRTPSVFKVKNIDFK